MSRTGSGKIFLSYRRADTSGEAGRFYDQACRRFGKENIFWDVGSMKPGDAIQRVVKDAIDHSDVLLVVIGDRWLGVHEDGTRRIDEADDPVRLEIKSALESRVRIVPVLVDQSSMPARGDLPDDIAELADLLASHLRHETFARDVESLLRLIEAPLRAVSAGRVRRILAVLAARTAPTTSDRGPAPAANARHRSRGSHPGKPSAPRGTSGTGLVTVDRAGAVDRESTVAVAIVVLLGCVLSLLLSGGRPSPQPQAPAPLSAPTAPTGPCGVVLPVRFGAGDGVFRIGAVYPLAGDSPLAQTTPALLAATQMGIDDVRAAGMASLQLDYVRTQDEGLQNGDPTGPDAACRAVGVLREQGVDVIVGPEASSSALAAYPMVTASQGLMISPTATDPQLTGIDDGGLFFRTAVPDTAQGDVLADAVADAGHENVVVVAADTAYGQALQKAIVNRLHDRDVHVRPISYDQGPKIDFAEALAAANTAGTDGLVLIGYDEIGQFLKLLLHGTHLLRNDQIYGTDGFLQNDFTQEFGLGPAEIEGMRGTVPWADPAFNARIKRQPGGDKLKDLTYAAQAYDAVIVSALAAVAARSDDPELIAKQMQAVSGGGKKCGSYQECLTLLKSNPAADIDYDGASGPLELNSAGEPCRSSFLISQFDRNGLLQAMGPRKDVTVNCP